MIDFNNEKNMYDMFIEKNVLTTQELLSAGFTNKDLTRLIDDHKIRRIERGLYELENAQGLFKYTQMLFGEKHRNIDRATKGLKRCVEIEPNNYFIQKRMFLNAIIVEDFEQALKSFAVMDKTNNENYKRTQDMWLYLLSFVVELPEEYKTRVRNLKLDDILTLENDRRFIDRQLQDRIRTAIYKHNFKEALELSKTLTHTCDRKIGVMITEKLLNKVIAVDTREHDYLYDLIAKGYYEEAETLFTYLKDLHGIDYNDEQFLIVLGDMLGILKDKQLPETNKDKDISNFNEAILAHNYEKALEIYRETAGRNMSKSNKFMGLLLERIKSEIDKLVLINKLGYKAMNLFENFSKENDDLFALIVANLMEQDVDTAFTLLDSYLDSIGKSNFRGYVGDLIKLSVLKKDMSFEEPILLLSDLSRDEFDFSIAVYIQYFYFSLVRKQFKEAAIYLDILSMSEQLGDVEIITDGLREKLIKDAKNEGIALEELGMKDVIDNGDLEVSTNTIVESSYGLTDVFDDIIENKGMAILAPMEDEEAELVLDTVKRIPKIQAVLFEEDTGEKCVALRYYDKFGPYVNISAALRAADYKYNNSEYEDAIELYQSVLPKLEYPRSFIFARLGECYQKIASDGNYSKAIDYYTMANLHGDDDNDNELDYNVVISELKTKSQYNGVKVQVNDSVQYKKEYN